MSTAIYVCTSPLSAFFAGVHARSYHKNDICYLIIDAGPRKNSLIERIYASAAHYSWKQLVDFSVPIDNDADLAPSVRKKITRRFKTNPAIKPFYSVLLRRYQKKLKAENIQRLKQLQIPENEKKHVYLLHQTIINDALIEHFKPASVAYYEHGLGDYSFWKSHHTDKSFYCLFSEAFYKYMAQQTDHSLSVLPLSTSVIKFPAQHAPIPTTGKKDLALWIIQPLDIYHVSGAFWQQYTAKVIELCKLHKIERLLLKFHPLQSNKSIELITKLLEKSGIVILNPSEKTYQQEAIEFVFDSLKKDIKIVVSLFSSSVFYLSEMYSTEDIKFYYSYDFLNNAISKAPAQYKTAYIHQKDLIEQVFSKNCISF